MIGKSKNSRRNAEVFYIKFSMAPLTCNKYKQKRAAAEKRRGNCHIFANSRWAILPFPPIA
jgi:hypothetical protein